MLQTALNLSVPQKVVIFLPSRATIDFSSKQLAHETQLLQAMMV
jgi:hypothetical protein